MCDYSLMMIPNRLAVEGEQLTTHKFKNGSIGLVSTLDIDRWQAQRSMRLWHRFRDCFSSQGQPAPVVCIPPGARLRLHNISSAFRGQFGLRTTEDATFTQLSADANRYRDALLFPDKIPVPLQLLPVGQMVTVLELSSLADNDADRAFEIGVSMSPSLFPQ